MNTVIFIISGKGHTGKDTTASFIRDYALTKGKKTLKLQFSSYIKMYVKNITDWDGSEETKPRELLQDLGSTIRENIKNTFFIDRIIDDIKIYSNYFDIITITDARLPEELDLIKEAFPNSIKLNIQRPNYENNLSLKAKNHITEHALDNYHNFDYIIINDGSLDDLKEKVEQILTNNI